MAKKIERLKCIVRPIGSFMYLNSDFTEIHFNRPSVTLKTDLVEQLRDDGKLRILAIGLPIVASDLEFKDCYIQCNSNDTLAINAYCAEFGQTPSGEKLITDIDTE